MWHLIPNEGFPGDSVVKKLLANAGDAGSIPVWERSPGGGNGNPLQYSCLENSMDREAWQVSVHGVLKSWTWFSDWACMRASQISHWQNFMITERLGGTSLLIQWLRLYVPNAGDLGLVPGQGNRSHLLPLRVCMSQLKKKISLKLQLRSGTVK